MTTQPEALDLADWLESVSTGLSANKAASELRRLHAENEELREALQQTEVVLQEVIEKLYMLLQPVPADGVTALDVCKAVSEQAMEITGLLQQEAQPAQQPDTRTAAIQSCIDRLIFGGQPAAAQILRHHFAKDLGAT